MRTPLLLPLLLGCAPPPYTPPDTAPPGPSIEFTWPLPETELVGCVVATVNIENFDVVTWEEGMALVDGQGHWHVEHPAGPSTYDVCDKPWCVAHFEEMKGTVKDFLRATLVDNAHQPIFDDQEQKIQASLPASFSGGKCATDLGGEPYKDTGW